MILFICLFIIIAIIYKRYDHVHFLSKEETMDIITNNTSFYQTFSSADLHARHVSSVEEYIQKLKEKKVTSSPTLCQTIILQICSLIADIRLYFIENNENYQHIKDISSLKWNIGIINNKFYEDGMPHTIKYKNKVIIIIPSHIIDNYSFQELISALIHEKVHVYQKTFPEKIDSYLKSQNYEKSTSSSSTLYRANPDTDLNIYKHLPTEKIYFVQYNSSNPSKITDTRGDNKYEHPFEEMAYHIENI
jgi:hypothetical protein